MEKKVDLRNPFFLVSAFHPRNTHFILKKVYQCDSVLHILYYAIFIWSVLEEKDKETLTKE